MSKRPHFILFFILFTHLISIISPANAAVTSFSNVNSDLVAICNGTGKIQWISLSDYYQTGKINFVAPPKESNKSHQNTINCSICLAFSTVDEQDFLITTLAVTQPLTTTNQASTLPYPVFTAQVKHVNTRAPPCNA